MGQKLLLAFGSVLFALGLILTAWYLLTPLALSPSLNLATPNPPLPGAPQLNLTDKTVYTPPPFPDTLVPFPVHAKAGVAFDITTGQVFWSKDAYTPHFIASLSKIMTAVVALELGLPNETLTVPLRATQVGEATMYLKEGEKYTLEELLWGLMFHSANDAAETIATGIAGRSLLFTQYMNQKAKQLNLASTFFVNPSGLDEDINTAESLLPGRIFQGQIGSTSSAHDLAILTKYALDNYPLIAQIVKSHQKVLRVTSGHPGKTLYNVMQLSRTYPGLIGIKSGNSHLAGLTVIELAKKNGHEVLIILLDTPNPRQETINLLNYAFQHL